MNKKLGNNIRVIIYNININIKLYYIGYGKPYRSLQNLY